MLGGISNDLAQDKKSYVREWVVEAIKLAFLYIPDKNLALMNLHALARDEKNQVRRKVAEALGLIFPYIPDKSQAWQDIVLLALDENSYVREGIAKALIAAFPHVPDKILLGKTSSVSSRMEENIRGIEGNILLMPLGHHLDIYPTIVKLGWIFIGYLLTRIAMLERKLLKP